MAKIKNLDISQSWQVCGGNTLHTLLVRIEIGVIFLQGNLAMHMKRLEMSKTFVGAVPNLGIYPKDIIKLCAKIYPQGCPLQHYF